MDLKSSFGGRTYNAQQKNVHSNLIYQTIIGNTNHTLKSGLSFNVDDYDEVYREFDAYKRLELIPGAFAEYGWNSGEVFNLVLGARVDKHNIIGSDV